MALSKRIVLHYPPSLTEKPIVYQLVKKYDCMFNILKAQFSVEGEGMLLLELTGTQHNLSRSLKYLKAVGIKTEFLSQDIVRIDEKCVHCGLCSSVCPTAAFSVDAPSMEVTLEPSRCMGCEECVRVCPYNAVKVLLT
jgi:Pyruvate/2-oxoacid:ferredoxin oxidoreductase delta subunit